MLFRSLLHHPVTQWPEFVLKLNPLGITRDLSASETWSGEQTVVGRPSASTAVSSDSARAMQSLGSVVYELLGGTLSPLASGGDIGAHYTPLANLSEHGNEALRFALECDAIPLIHQSAVTLGELSSGLGLIDDAIRCFTIARTASTSLLTTLAVEIPKSSPNFPLQMRD